MLKLRRAPTLLLFFGLVAGLAGVRGQSAPPAPSAPYHSRAEQDLGRALTARTGAQVEIDPAKSYTLAELIDLAERHNPETRVAWEEAKAKASILGIERSALYPTISALAVAISARQAALIGEYFHRQTLGVFEPVLNVEYLIFDAGGRSGAIDVAKANLLVSDLAFNDRHLNIILAVASAYYRLLNAVGQREASQASLDNAKAVENDAESRLENGLATKPDQMEATAARDQADYDFQAAEGAVTIARGNLATAIGLPPQIELKVQPIDELTLPTMLADSVDAEIERALHQRPELLEQMAHIKAADSAIKQARSTYFPSLSFHGDGGMARAYGQQDLLAGSYAQGEVWTAELDLKWTLFDGAHREYTVARAEAEKKAAEANLEALRDEISDQVWTAYTNMRTALRQEQAAAALLAASQQSYEAAHEAYGYGVRNLLDVVSAQKALAQARSEDVLARSELLLAVTNMAFRTGDLIATPPTKALP